MGLLKRQNTKESLDEIIRVAIMDFLKKHYIIEGSVEIVKEYEKYIVNCFGSLWFRAQELKYQQYLEPITKLTNDLFEFGEVQGTFYCAQSNITTLKGCPKSVYHFDCSSCIKLTSLEGAPEVVKDSFDCSYCKNLENLVGCPNTISTSFSCYGCEKLTNFIGAPEKVGLDFNGMNCKNLTSLEGAPKEVGRDFDCSFNNCLKSLIHAPKIVPGWFSCGNCINLESFEGIPENIGYGIDIRDCDKLLKSPQKCHIIISMRDVNYDLLYTAKGYLHKNNIGTLFVWSDISQDWVG